MNDPTVQDGFISVTGGRVWYRMVGSSDTIPLLMLHGGPGLDSNYLAPLEALADERPIVRYDQLGGGQADHPDDLNLWTIERFVEELGQVREALKLTQVHLLGHSWGNMLAVSYILTKPSGVQSLILAGPWLNPKRYLEDVSRLISQLPSDVQRVIRYHEQAGTTNSREYQNAVMEFYRRHLCRLDSFLEGLKQALAEGHGMPPVYQFMWGPSEFTGIGSLKDHDLTMRLHEITIPCLLTCGRFDETTPETTAYYQTLIPESEMKVFEKSAHMPHLEETEQYLNTLRDFLHRVEAD